MNVADITRELQQNAFLVVFINVLLEQLGLPLPAVPALLVAGSLAMTFGQAAEVLTAALIASLIADSLWFWVGSLFGYRVLAGLCRLSINPGSCVTQTEARFIRWGLPSLLLAKFIPGFSTVAPPIAGALRMSPVGFLLAAASGAALWAAVAIGAGWVLRGAVPTVLVALDRHAVGVTAVVLLAFGAWLGWKLWRKHQFRKTSVLPHITAAELLEALAGPEPPLILDLRGAVLLAEAGPIPGAIVAQHDRLHEAVGGRRRDRPIVTLCACPEDAGAVLAARRLLDSGFHSVRPLTGGWEAWRAATAQGVATPSDAAATGG
ncbi:MAG TPA: VTT domain-containing protein [Steroidobacteraceae bacterium]|nr:VTT domain-containing protein [Steroidobacteraceae bacterium]